VLPWQTHGGVFANFIVIPRIYSVGSTFIASVSADVLKRIEKAW
jgi:hypothetical protein